MMKHDADMTMCYATQEPKQNVLLPLNKSNKSHEKPERNVNQITIRSPSKSQLLTVVHSVNQAYSSISHFPVLRTN